MVSERTVGPVTVLDVEGAITFTEGAERLRDKIRSLLQEGRRQIVVNLAGAAHVDSVGLGELVRAYATTARQGGQLKVLNATRRLRDLLVITKLAPVFELYESEADVLASFTATT